jgi:hypothetical protein
MMNSTREIVSDSSSLGKLLCKKAATRGWETKFQIWFPESVSSPFLWPLRSLCTMEDSSLIASSSISWICGLNRRFRLAVASSALYSPQASDSSSSFRASSIILTISRFLELLVFALSLFSGLRLRSCSSS